MPAKVPQRYKILGVEVDSLTMRQAVERIGERAQLSQAVYVTKPYVEFFDVAVRNETVRRLLNDSFLCLPDGVSTQWAAQYLYGGRRWWGRGLWLAASIILKPSAIQKLIPEKFGGATFTWELLKYCQRHKLTVYLIGSPKKGSIATTAAAIIRQLPDLKIVGTRPGELAGLRGEALRKALVDQQPVADDLLQDIQAKQPNIILVGVGFPLQETLMANLAPQLSHGVLIGEGGTFDYDSFGGIRKRAPKWIQRIGLEWLWRLTIEPTRIERQRAIPRFMWRVYQAGKTDQNDA